MESEQVTHTSHWGVGGGVGGWGGDKYINTEAMFYAGGKIVHIECFTSSRDLL